MLAENLWTGLEELREPLRGLLSRFSRDENELDDVIQETFIRAARYRARLDDDALLKPWAMRIALNVLVDGRRARSRLGLPAGPEALLDLPAGPATGEESGESELRIGSFVVEESRALSMIRELLPALPGRDQELLMSYYGGAECTQASAEICGVPRHLVKIRLFRARRRLLRAIKLRLSHLDERNSLLRLSA